MCGRTSLFVPQSVLEARFDAAAARPIRPRYNIAPGDDLAVIRNDEPGTIDQLTWGLVPHWADDPSIGNRLINARAETLAEKPSFRDAYAKRRCLVLADGFYEWQARPGGKQPYRIALRDDAPFAMAGLWERWKRNGETRRTVTVVTTGANDLLRPLHDRMPVVLASDEEERWLNADDADARRALLDPYDGDDLRAYPVSTAINDPGNDTPAVVEPVAADDQSELDEF